MNDPYIVASCGHSFEKKNIYDWIKINRNCPVCKRKAELSDLIPNFALKTIIQKKKDEVKAAQTATNVNQSTPINQNRSSLDYPTNPTQIRPTGEQIRPYGGMHQHGFSEFPSQQGGSNYQNQGYYNDPKAFNNPNSKGPGQ